jgi:hypothetical protein
MAQDLAPVPYKANLTESTGVLTRVWSEWFRVLRELTLGRRIVTVTEDYTAALTDDVIFADATSGILTVTLPSPDTCKGKQFSIKKIDSSGNDVTVSSAVQIDGAVDQALDAQYDSLTVVSTGIYYFILGDR